MTMKKNGNGSFAEFYKVVNFLVPDFKKFAAQKSFISLVYESLKLVPVYIIKLIVDNIFGTPDLKKDAMLILIIFAILVLLTVIDMATFAYSLKQVIRFQRNLLERIHKKLLQLPLAFHERQSTGAIVSRINKAASHMNDLFWFVSNDIIPVLFQIIVTSVLLIKTEWHIGLLYMASLPMIIWLNNWNAKRLQPYRKVYHHIFDEATGELAQSLYNIKTVKDYSQEEREHKKYSRLLIEYAKKSIERGKVEAWFITWKESFTNAIRALAMLAAVWFVIKGTLTPGDLVLIFTLGEKAFINLHRLGRVYNYLGDSYEALRRVKGILEEPNTLLELENPRVLNNQLGAIEFRNVDFSYGTEDVLKNISFKVPAKKIVAIIGESGSGKSTITKLLARHYDPIKGAVLIDNIDLKKLTLNSVRTKISVVSQHTEIFNRTIHENIAYARPNATRKEVINAAKKANAHRFIMSFRKGYETLVGERGIRLSGGQQQRLSIARALLADPEVLVFDEATSSLDSESEKSIQNALFAVRGNYTMVIIAHRLSTIENADLIVVMDNGKIAEIGVPSELLNKKEGLYKKMHQLQRLGELRK